ncbi:MAG TPA: hypothetical protein VHE60_08285, partial [Pyrinomonadaceae bacterium]|nr:hypothetical protein [Pyrinomonadaceae bacterium]
EAVSPLPGPLPKGEGDSALRTLKLRTLKLRTLKLRTLKLRTLKLRTLSPALSQREREPDAQKAVLLTTALTSDL